MVVHRALHGRAPSAARCGGARGATRATAPAQCRCLEEAAEMSPMDVLPRYRALGAVGRDSARHAAAAAAAARRPLQLASVRHACAAKATPDPLQRGLVMHVVLPRDAAASSAACS